MPAKMKSRRHETRAACPFCGNKRPKLTGGLAQIAGMKWRVVCMADACTVNPSTFLHPSKGEAIAAWNTRSKAK